MAGLAPFVPCFHVERTGRRMSPPEVADGSLQKKSRRAPGGKFHGGFSGFLIVQRILMLGNDFVVLNGISQIVDLSPEQIRFICDRQRGIGCDQILLVERPSRPDVDFRYRIFNRDGHEVEHCGNGARCFVHFVRAEGLTNKREIRVETKNGVIVPKLQGDHEVTVDMGAPRFKPSDIPFRREQQALLYDLQVGQTTIRINALSMGNPHAVQFVEDVEGAPVTIQGPLIEHHQDFPERVNAGYVQIVSRNEIKLRVWERGAGETLACGTGACAAVVAGIQRRMLDSRVAVQTHGGKLTIEWQGNGAAVIMTGPAAMVFRGEIEL
jgi:diaminopimelate epimerase